MMMPESAHLRRAISDDDSIGSRVVVDMLAASLIVLTILLLG